MGVAIRKKQIRAFRVEPSRCADITLEPAETRPRWFRYRLAKGGSWVAAEIRHEPPRDPVTGEELDRSWVWYAVVDSVAEPGDHVPTRRVMDIWLFGEVVDEAMYRWLLEDRAWARRYAPQSLEANPKRVVDLSREPIVYR